MGIIIALASFGGDYLDNINNNSKPIYTIIGSLLGVTAGLYLLYRNVIKNDNKIYSYFLTLCFSSFILHSFLRLKL